MRDEVRARAIRSVLLGLASGTLYGVMLRAASAFDDASGTLQTMTIGFLFLGPLAVGFLTVRPHPSPSSWYRVFAPWLPVLLSAGVAALIGWEGSICIVFALPIILPMGSLGGILTRWIKRGATASVSVAIAPFIVSGAESSHRPADDVHQVQTSIVIHATRDAVWSQIASVPEIQPAELPSALYLRLGFPRPLSAEISRRGVGGVRRARFAGGVLFLERVTTWEPGSALSFEIAAQPDSTLPGTLDQHVVVGGRYIDVLRGTYRLTPLDAEHVRLDLESRLRLSTPFNWYSRLWADAVMRSIQETILEVERQRAERRTA